MKTHTREFRDNLTPQQALELLQDGNKRFINNLKINRNLLQQMNETADDQHPFAVTLSCIDSRTSFELIFDQGLGEILSIRIAGNIVNDDIVGSMEYACAVLGVKLIIVLGHTRCGAIKSACEGVEMGNVTGLLEKIKPAIEKTSSKKPDDVAHTNVLLALDEILERSSIIRGMFKEGKIGIIGGMYSVENGKVNFTQKMFAETQQEKARIAV